MGDPLRRQLDDVIGQPRSELITSGGLVVDDGAREGGEGDLPVREELGDALELEVFVDLPGGQPTLGNDQRLDQELVEETLSQSGILDLQGVALIAPAACVRDVEADIDSPDHVIGLEGTVFLQLEVELFLPILVDLLQAADSSMQIVEDGAMVRVDVSTHLVFEESFDLAIAGSKIRCLSVNHVLVHEPHAILVLEFLLHNFELSSEAGYFCVPLFQLDGLMALADGALKDGSIASKFRFEELAFESKSGLLKQQEAFGKTTGEGRKRKFAGHSFGKLMVLLVPMIALILSYA